MFDAMPDRRNNVLIDRRAFPRVAVDTGERKERRRGRPPVGDGRSERIDTRVIKDTFDAICRQAQRDGKTLSEHVRDILDREAARELLSGKNRQRSSSAPL